MIPMPPPGTNTQRVCTRLTRKPIATAESANSRKKLEPTGPNSRGLSFSSCMIGMAAIPITALQAKLISVNMKARNAGEPQRIADKKCAIAAVSAGS